MREAETDAQGRFELERAQGLNAEGDESIAIYKFGYVAWNNEFIFPTWKRRQRSGVPAKVRLDPFPLGEDHREHVRFIHSGVRAGMYGQGLSRKFDNALDREERMR